MAERWFQEGQPCTPLDTERSPHGSKLKGLLRESAARTRDALDEAIRRAMGLIDKHDAPWFKYCGYQLE